MTNQSIKTIAFENGWGLLDEQPFSHLISFQKGDVRINVWTGKRGITVGTCLDHPKKGKTQLFRKNVSRNELVAIFSNPRVHTDKGYRKREDAPAAVNVVNIAPEGKPPISAKRIIAMQVAMLLLGILIGYLI